jgi:flagellar hook-associated protein 3 FlgL
MTADNALYNLQQGRARLDVLQEQIASGKIINKPSDDPLTTRQLLELQNKVNEGKQYISNIQKGSLNLNLTSTAVDGIASMVSLALKVAGSISSGSSDPNVRQDAVLQVNELRSQLVDLGNTQIGDQYIFAGFNTATKPFDKITGAYSGTDDAITIEINKGSQIGININGSELLKGTGAYGSTDVIAAFDSLATAITNNDVPGITAAANDLEASAKQIANASSDIRARLSRLSNANKLISTNQDTLSSIISDRLSIDNIKAALELNSQKNAFEAALSSTAKITQLSLLDYLL